jgi:DNA-binding transcriptional ArsR family regulator
LFAEVTFFTSLNGKRPIMGAIKSNNYSEINVQLSLITRALAHPARIEMIKTLRSHPSFRNIDFVDSLNLSRPTIKDHVEKLKDAELVSIAYFPHHYEICLTSDPLLLLAAFVLETCGLEAINADLLAAQSNITTQ